MAKLFVLRLAPRVPGNDAGAVRVVPHMFLLACAAALTAASSASAADWPHWRGADRNDVVDEPSGFRDGAWPLEEAWRRNVGEGSTSPVVVGAREGARLYTMGWRGDEEHVQCLDAATGREIWRRSYQCPRYGRFASGDKERYSGPSSTPSFDPGMRRLYTLGIDGDLACWDEARGGERVWGFNLYDTYGVDKRADVGGAHRDYGYTGSPLVLGGHVIVEVGASGRERPSGGAGTARASGRMAGTLVAFDKRTGEQAWASDYRGDAGQNAGPVPMTVDGVPCVVAHTLRDVVVVRIDPGHEGETLARYEWTTMFANNVVTPGVIGNRVVISSGYDRKKMALLEITPAGRAAPGSAGEDTRRGRRPEERVRRVWENRHYVKVCSPVIYEGCIYTAHRKVRCIDLETGRLLWEGASTGEDGSCLVTSDGRLVAFSRKGLLLAETARRSPDEYTELASRRDVVRETAWPHVVLAGGRVYCKDRKGNVKCFELGR